MAAILIFKTRSDVITVANDNQLIVRHNNLAKHVAAKSLWL